jgi:hypothetical protein
MDNINITRDNTIIILDWDDTLYPTSWVIKNNIDITDSKIRKKYIGEFMNLDIYISKLLLSLKKYGEVVIITNAMLSWVTLTLTVLPLTNKIVNNLELISAREKYSKLSEMTDWKKHTFNELMNRKLKKKEYNNLISIGDSKYEHNALINLYHHKLIPNKYIKIVRLIRNVNYDELIEELKRL